MLSLITLLTAGTASAATHEVSFELGSFGSNDDNFELFSDYESQVKSLGLRGGYAVTERLAVVASWHHDAVGGEVEDLLDGDVLASVGGIDGGEHVGEEGGDGFGLVACGACGVALERDLDEGDGDRGDTGDERECDGGARGDDRDL